MKYVILILYVFISATSVMGQWKKTIIWSLDNFSNIGGMTPLIIGNPKLEANEYTSLYFDGENDGLIFPVNPIEGSKKFTVEVLFKPLQGGSAEQRFIHFQDKEGNRGLIEIRLQHEEWWLDTYLHVGETDKGLTLVNRTSRHPCNRWYWAALVYDGKTMNHFLNGEEELSGEINFGPMKSGMISIGVRLNQLYWFKGNISKIHFHSKPLRKEKLQKIDF